MSAWLDDLSRERLTSGTLAALARDRGASGATTSPAIFARAIAGSDAYAGQIRHLRLRRAATASLALGLRKVAARLDDWAKDVAPSTGLRTWYRRDPAKFEEFGPR